MVFYVIYNNVKNNLARVSTKARISIISRKYNPQIADFHLILRVSSVTTRLSSIPDLSSVWIALYMNIIIKAMIAQSIFAITQYQAVLGQVDKTLPGTPSTNQDSPES